MRAKGNGVNERAVGREQTDGIAGLGQLEVHMQVGTAGTVLGGLLVRPDEEEAARRDAVASRNQELGFVGQVVAQVIAGQRDGVGAGIGPLIAGALMRSGGPGMLYVFTSLCAVVLVLATRVNVSK